MMTEKTKDEHLQEAALAVGLWRDMGHNLERQRAVLDECRAQHGSDTSACPEHNAVMIELFQRFDEANQVFQVVVGEQKTDG